MDKDALAKHILEVLQGQAFTVFQTAVVSFHSVRVCVQVFEMETESTDLKVALCMGKHPRLGAKSALQQLDEAQLEVIWRRQVASGGDKLALLDGNSVVMCSFHCETRSPVIHDQDLHNSFRAEGIRGKLHPSLDNRNGHISHTIDGGRFSPANLSDASGDVPLPVARREDRLSPIHTAPSAPPVFVPEHPKSHNKVIRPSPPNCPSESKINRGSLVCQCAHSPSPPPSVRQQQITSVCTCVGISHLPFWFHGLCKHVFESL